MHGVKLQNDNYSGKLKQTGILKDFIQGSGMLFAAFHQRKTAGAHVQADAVHTILQRDGIAADKQLTENIEQRKVQLQCSGIIALFKRVSLERDLGESFTSTSSNSVFSDFIARSTASSFSIVNLP